MTKHHSRRWFIAGGAAVILVGVVVSLALAQPARRAPQVMGPMDLAAQPIQAGLFLPGIREQSIKLAPARLQAIKVGKQQANLNVLSNAYFMRNNIPFLRLAQGKEIELLSLESMEGQPTPSEASEGEKLPAEMQAYSAHLKIPMLAVKAQMLTPLFPPSSVDHRSKQTPIKDQQNRGTCVAFASMAGMESKYGSTSLDLSEQDAYHIFMRKESKTCCSSGLKTTDSADYLKASAVTTEPNWGYQNQGALGCPIANPNTHRPSAASSNAKHKVNSFQKIWRNDSLTEDSGTYINNPKYLESLLHQGKDVVFGTHVAGWSGNLAGILDVKLTGGGNPLPSAGGHAVLMVGYDRPQQYFIVKNSWGTGYGQSGYLYLSYDYIRTYAKYGYVINSVEPITLVFSPVIMRRAPIFRRPGAK
jgi:hypothetical protein